MLSSGTVVSVIRVTESSRVSILFGLCCRTTVCYGLVKLKCSFLSISLKLRLRISTSLQCVFVRAAAVVMVVSISRVKGSFVFWWVRGRVVDVRAALVTLAFEDSLV